MNVKKNFIKTLWLGIAFGLLLTALLWLHISAQTYAILRWASYAGVACLGLYLLIRNSRRRAFSLLAAFASVALLYLFPMLFGPACNGIPKAFARPYYGGACGRDCNFGCCINEQCSPCPQQDDAPPNISGALICAQLGANGWCRNNARLEINASDPQGYALTISGAAGSLPISCGGGCIVTLPKGSGAATYTAHAAASGLSASGSAFWKYDPNPPVADLNLSGASGLNGWYTSAVNVVARGVDALSGLASATLSVDGGAAVSSKNISGNGVHTVNVTAVDNAGNTDAMSVSVKVDTVAPAISKSLSAAPIGEWYTQAPILTVSAADATSGLASISILDNGAPIVSPATLSDGAHTISIRATDVAGNSSADTLTVKVDSAPPLIAPSLIGTLGDREWYVSAVEASAAISDATSGVASTSALINGAAYSLPYAINEDGETVVIFNATDNAGNSVSQYVIVKIDKTPPVMSVSKTGAFGDNGWRTSNVDFQISATDATSGPQYGEYRLDAGAWQTGMAFAVSGDGTHTVEYRVFDNAGNVAAQSESVKIDTTAPSASFSSPAPNSLAMGALQINGQSADATSGLSGAQISFDNVRWLPLPMSAADWSYVWDTADLPNGAVSIFARSVDLAGNIGVPAQIAVVLDNHPPFVSLSKSWNIWESGDLSVKPNGIPLKRVKIVAHDPMQRYADEIIYDGLSAPKKIIWDRILGNVIAPAGSYSAEVEACDIYDLCSKASGAILIPVASTPVPFQLPAIEIPKSIPIIPLLQTPAPQQPVVVAPVVAAPVHAEAQPISFPFWTTFVLGALLLSFALLLLLDPRPKAWRSLTQRLADSLPRRTS